MARRRRQPASIAFAESVTGLWALVLLSDVVLPRVTGSTAWPSRENTLILVALGLAMVAAWVWAVHTMRAQNARGKRLDELQAMVPEAFEEWVGARFRERGYSVEITGAQGDHGIDLIAKKPDETAVVQVKKYVTKPVGEPVLRDLYGAMHATGANKAYLVTTGRVTDAARKWAADKTIAIWDAETVTNISLSDQSTVPTTPVPKHQVQTMGETSGCPRCGSALVERRNRRTGEHFQGCARFPACRYTSAA